MGRLLFDQTDPAQKTAHQFPPLRMLTRPDLFAKDFAGQLAACWSHLTRIRSPFQWNMPMELVITLVSELQEKCLEVCLRSMSLWDMRIDFFFKRPPVRAAFWKRKLNKKKQTFVIFCHWPIAPARSAGARGRVEGRRSAFFFFFSRPLAPALRAGARGGGGGGGWEVGGGECVNLIFFTPMEGPFPPFTMELVLLHYSRPKDLLQWARVCKNWYTHLRSDEFWSKFKNHVTSQLPLLASLFSAGMPIWRVFAHQLWPLAKNVKVSAMNMHACSLEISASVVTSQLRHLWPFCYPKGELTVFTPATVDAKLVTFLAHFSSGEFVKVACVLSVLRPDYKTHKLLGLKQETAEMLHAVRCTISMHSPGKPRSIQKMSTRLARDFFRPFFRIVFCSRA